MTPAHCPSSWLSSPSGPHLHYRYSTPPHAGGAAHRGPPAPTIPDSTGRPVHASLACTPAILLLNARRGLAHALSAANCRPRPRIAHLDPHRPSSTPPNVPSVCWTGQATPLPPDLLAPATRKQRC
eukprot:CAMPEP_0115253422 /NCGR_PEP_ID=MMETSP0270-20121206/44662_1 /TAXON_ID=71861 /ORGANISM="Scrippsiella trochoidea, Strain CCMP3099" /LENGTH=125 /DNA_ID=CAMNT_0002668923 /DNA_START=97 /DNA_END=474 /DNA_ORIENTATION=-